MRLPEVVTIHPPAGITTSERREVRTILDRWWTYRGPAPYAHRERWHGRRPKRRRQR